ncbi:efflux transporter outer membrane subunit [Mucilaginibacter roseus]|uniref:Efflux transporter outer membrane subunit n=1 Tax=Mucilaginibacter roseus TaxID=1528868 RepID=A0ABS8U7L7_9SPHI|nr:efflux transporter outer membrane subunit [Mucilaginibacter roseus]MCD8742113.1 efflux transporter outer membrane subunit [Mucilaginibacter roseus]
MSSRRRIYRYIGIAGLSLIYAACRIPPLAERTANKNVPTAFGADSVTDTTNTAKVVWRNFFQDQYLKNLIDTALKNNQELNITMQEIEMSRNEIKARKGEYLPFVGVKAGAGLDKVARYTSRGASEATTEIMPGKEMPDPLPDYLVAAYATWEVDIWHKLRNAKKAAVSRYLASVEGRNFMVTHLITEIADSYYELLALDNQLSIVKQNIAIQQNALKIVRLQKEAARVTELAVRRFEAQVLSTQSLQYDIQQQIVETQNKINFLLGRYPQPIARSSEGFENLPPLSVQAGLPSQLLVNRPDIRQAELNIAAAKLDVKSAKARFYPSLGISASIGYQAFNPSFLLNTPESLLYSIGGDIMAPLVNRNAIKAEYVNANAKQIQAVFDYERTVLNAYIEVANQMSKMDNLEKSYALKSKQVLALSQSVKISNDLFTSTRADYMEVLLTQREALEAKFELIETKKQQINARINIYQALGGGWE